jgi:large subunit ribosomal protein L5
MRTIQNYCETDLKTDILLKKRQKNVLKGIKIDKIVINAGVKETNINLNKILPTLLIIKLLSQQQPICTKAKKSIANFKLRTGKIIGCKVTLRGLRKNNFFEKFIHIIMPQIIDSKRISYKNRSPKNHITLGIEDSNMFLELENQYDLFPKIIGMEINICSKENEKSIDHLLFSGLKINFQ